MIPSESIYKLNLYPFEKCMVSASVSKVRTQRTDVFSEQCNFYVTEL